MIRGGIQRAAEAHAGGFLPLLEVDPTIRIGAPIARPGAIVCIGMNYAAHAAETGDAPPAQPVLFYKHPNTIVGPNDPVRIPRDSVKTDWEVELAVVIGSPARYLSSPDEALAHVAGYTISNDVSERAFQIEVSGGQWSKGKGCETFNPLGPWLVTPDEAGDPQDAAADDAQSEASRGRTPPPPTWSSRWPRSSTTSRSSWCCRRATC